MLAPSFLIALLELILLRVGVGGARSIMLPVKGVLAPADTAAATGATGSLETAREEDFSPLTGRFDEEQGETTDLFEKGRAYLFGEI